jgi:hypothetical protein
MTKTYKTVYTPEPIAVELSTEAANKIAIQRLCDVFDWNTEWYIGTKQGESGTLYVEKNVEAYTTHSFNYNIKIRLATPQDLVIFDLINKLKKSL